MPKSQRKEAIRYVKDEEWDRLMASTNNEELKNAFKAYKSRSLNAAQFKPSMKALINEYIRLKNELQVQSREEVDMDIENDEEEEMEDRFEKMRELKENAEAANEMLKKQVQCLQEKVEKLQAGSEEMDVMKASLAAEADEREKLEKEVESLREELERQKTDFEKEKAAMVKDVERLNKEVENLKNAHEKEKTAMKASMAEKVREVEGLTKEVEQLKSDCENQKRRTKELLLHEIDNGMKKLEQPKKEKERSKAELETADKRPNALDNALQFCHTRHDAAYKEKIQRLEEMIEKMRSEHEKEKAAMVKDVERLNKEVETLKNAHGTLSNERERLAKFASECQELYNGFVKDLGDMIKEANTVLGVKQEEEPTTVAQTLQEFYLKFKEVLACLSNSKSEVESQKKSILDLNGTIASKEEETTAAQNELSEERWDRQLLLQWIETVNQWLEYGEDGTEDEERVRFSKVDTIPEVKALLLFSGYNPESEWRRPKPLQD